LTGVEILDFGEKEEIGPAEMREGFSQDPPRQKLMVSKTDMGVNEQDIEIPMEWKMLISIVQ
jgi:hypothetical protein